ncbi:hypothetical protein BCR37DRAFT_376255 [Protomyces lactucae-debilis]|uniref:Uncharacterized protein n=1 Tax=Protomyces lactucae-debilis TaxID=2754530 RepID=A0A1Y2FSE5_PROLT|nr:uncharacterized protein BCR37DRAFT_383713 [Protomyces lactucae-debilis]XP_040727788.1 uncharacterized protein BCR37DRAFT_376255 [Protomyces lactucae-debilis]ORY76083.1 hypothetical protein BCR37DRAFT_383713 [Protomyces lactucae-debilis]ORY86932.1 hypothetical protein BCR37DRAFT_376255 [Protomyces lactucae-debilis]
MGERLATRGAQELVTRHLLLAGSACLVGDVYPAFGLASSSPRALLVPGRSRSACATVLEMLTSSRTQKFFKGFLLATERASPQNY